MKLNETQKTIVRQLFLNPVVCRKKLAHTLGLSNPGLTLAVRPLVDEGIIAFAPKIVTGRAGRNEEPLCLNPNFGYFAGIDVTVSSYHLVLISLAGFTVFEEDYSEVGPVLEKLKYFVNGKYVASKTDKYYDLHNPSTGEITGYNVAPASVSANEVATQNRLTVTVRVSFSNRKYPEDDFDAKSFSAYADYDTTNSLDAVESSLCAEIVDKLIEDIFNATVAQW